ncbi:hypothetical protein SAMN02910377_00192 [Pseudobutyrivibrio ruminis]|uniref:Uncharacterized protein n=1 Tax=Pseudobutyrivibrio ruminis TaxID=46206 RepID=A0A1H7EZX7_9FIRM|nr:hypothetical protein [Pseudobutyrivibrio ruminis]SEK18667.1 hypothetical protein SAMN02910377_00192 [Pseudobutyrivibrio ruminis]
MSVYVNNQFRIKRNAAQQEAMQRLVAAKIFDGYKDILMISAVIAYNIGAFNPIEKPASDGVLMQFFSSKDYDIIDMIAYAHKKEQSVITSDEKYEIFSSYANAGFPILLEKLELNGVEEISIDEARKAQIRYYRLLLSDGFSVSIGSEELLK